MPLLSSDTMDIMGNPCKLAAPVDKLTATSPNDAQYAFTFLIFMVAYFWFGPMYLPFYLMSESV